MNAYTLGTVMNSHPEIPENVEDVRSIASTGQNIVMGGLVPGYSTDAVAATVAELFDSELYIITDVDGVYTDDPAENPDAEKLESIDIDELITKVSGHNQPGKYDVVDEAALQTVKRSNLDAKLVEGTPENIRNPDQAPGTTFKV
jgi:uridylate kinase